MKIDTARIEAIIRETKSPHRYAHTMNVLKMALELAGRYGVDEEKTRIAALFHDLCKDGLKPDNDLAHAKEAAEQMCSVYGIEDEDILNAVRFHTTGRAGMSKLELIIFLADTLEPTRTYEGVGRLRDMVFEDLYTGALEVLIELNKYLVNAGKTPAKDSLDAIGWLEELVEKDVV
jgi:putative nucleotidyltransferase with HDIG domain